jgi:hypothetical protein
MASNAVTQLSDILSARDQASGRGIGCWAQIRTLSDQRSQAQKQGDQEPDACGFHDRNSIPVVVEKPFKAARYSTI